MKSKSKKINKLKTQGSDTEVLTSRITELTEAKKKSIEEEDFDEAGVLKERIDKLNGRVQYSGKMQEYEEKKKEKEEADKAKEE